MAYRNEKKEATIRAKPIESGEYTLLPATYTYQLEGTQKKGLATN